MSSHPTPDLVADRRVERGMRAQLARRAERIEAGERPLGWKLGFGTAPAMERLGISAPLVGFLMQSARVEDRATVSIGGMAKPALEPEVAVHLGSDLPAGDDAATRAAIAGLGPAFELADIDPPPEDVEAILAANIYQRGVVLGSPADRPSLEGVAARVVVNGADATVVADPEGPTGELIGLVRHVADVLAAFGEQLRAGEVVICGALVPPLSIAPGDRVEYELDLLGGLSLGFRD